MQGIVEQYANVTVGVPVLTLPPTLPFEIWSVFGTDTQGQAGNQIVGGPTLTATGAGPTYGANYATFNAGSVLAGLSTGLVWNSGLMASGFSLVWVGRVPATGAPSSVLSNGPTSASGFALNMQNNNSSSGNIPQIGVKVNGTNPTTGTLFQTGAQTGFKAYGLSWAGPASPINIYVLTDDTTFATANETLLSNSNTIDIGYYTSGVWCNPVDLAHFAFSTGAINQTTMQGQLYQAIQSLMSSRGISGV